jgi:thioredoxin reductase (NADPH)
MDRQPRVKAALSSGRVVDEIHWIYPYANHETLLYCIRCEGHLTRDTRTAVLGHAEVAAQVALMLRERYDTRVFLLTNGEELAVEPDTRRLLALEDVSVHGARITALRGAGQPKGSVLHGFELEDGLFLAADFGFVALGLHRVYNDLARELGAELEASDEDAERRHVLVEDATAETSVRGLFAVGDVAKRRDGGPLMKQIYTAQEYAVRAVDTIDRRRRAARRRARLGRS